LSQINPNEAVYDMNNISKEAPWKGKLSPVITSCGNMFTTSDGKDLLYEMVCILTYSYYQNVDVLIEG
jgi:formylmethanofuran dehydrogenase subunit E